MSAYAAILTGGLISIFIFLSCLFFKFYLFLEKEREWEKEGEKHQCVVDSHMAPTGDLACKPGMCPDWESNRQPFGSQPVLNPLTYTSQVFIIFYNYVKYL